MTLECNPPMKTLGLSAEDADKGAAAHVPRVKSGCCWPRNSGGSRPSSVSRRMSSWTTCADISLHRTRPVSGGLPCYLRAPKRSRAVLARCLTKNPPNKRKG